MGRVLLFLILIAGINAAAVWWVSRPPTARHDPASTPGATALGIPAAPAGTWGALSVRTWSRPFAPATETLMTQYRAQGIQQVGVIVRDVRTGEVYERNADTLFDAGSLYKLFVLWQTQVAIRTNVLGDETKLTLTAAADRADEDGYRIGAYGETISVADARTLMIEASNNTAAVLLAQYFGWGTVQQLARRNGFAATTLIDRQTTTARDVSRFFGGIVSRTLDPTLTDADYDLMLTLLKEQQINTKLSVGFPPDAIFAHKTGDIPGAHHDAGILFLPDNRAICVTVLTAGDYDASVAFQRDLAAELWRDLTG